ncbi:MAG: PfkB family carbohydrate kinase, partial [Planctomycetota bacterium]
PLLDDCLSIITKVRDAGAKVAVDTSGNALAKIVRLKGIWLIKPNIKEFRELLGRHVPNTAPEIAKAAQKLSDNVRLILVSRAAKGVIAVTPDKALQAEGARPLAKVTTTGPSTRKSHHHRRLRRLSARRLPRTNAPGQ